MPRETGISGHAHRGSAPSLAETVTLHCHTKIGQHVSLTHPGSARSFAETPEVGTHTGVWHRVSLTFATEQAKAAVRQTDVDLMDAVTWLSDHAEEPVRPPPTWSLLSS